MALPSNQQIEVIDGNADSIELMKPVFSSSDIVVSSLAPGASDPDFCQKHTQMTSNVINAAQQSEVNRIVLVGGAGMLGCCRCRMVGV
jgi:putative NADH-flavin reductase